jgi:nitroreductase
MNEMLELIATRYTARNYTGEEVPLEDIQAIAEAGAQAPSAVNRQPWQIIAITNQEIINVLETAGLEILASDAKYQKFYENIQKRGGKLFYNAPVVYIVAVHNPGDAKGLESAVRDCGIVIENMSLAAHALGYGNCICGLAGLGFLGDKAQDLRKLLNLQDDYEFGIGLLVGKTDDPKPAHQPDYSKISYLV